MHRYSRMPGSTSADSEKPRWKDYSFEALDLKTDGSTKWALRHNREQIQMNTDSMEKQSDPSTWGRERHEDEGENGKQFGFILTRALSLKENTKGKKMLNKASDRSQDSVPRDNSLQGAVKRAFSMRKSDGPSKFVAPDDGRLSPNADCIFSDWQEQSFKRSESMKYYRIAPPVELEEDGFAQKKKKSVFKTCKRLLGMKKN